MIKLLKYLRPYTLFIVLILGLTFVQVMTNLQLPDYMSQIVNKGIVQEDQQFILNTGLWMLGVSLLGGVCTIIASYLSSQVATGFARDVRSKVFQKVESFSMTEFTKFSPSSLITRSTNDIQQMQGVLIMILRMVLSAPIMGIGAIIKAYDKAPSMSWIIGLAVAALISIIITLFSIAIPKFKLLQKLLDKLNLVARENLTGIRVIRAFNAERFEERKFEKVNTQLTDTNLLVNRLMVIMQPFMMLIFNITAIAIIWVGAHLIGNGQLQIGDMIAFMQYAMQVIMSFLMISIVFIMIPRASVSGERIAEVLNTEPVIKDPIKPVIPKTDVHGKIEFKDVTFTYPGADAPVLTDISFVAKPGETTAIIGSTGSGKSTLIDLIPRFYDVSAGQILIDDVDIRDMTQKNLHDKIGYVPQRGVLFSGTILSNLKYGAPHASEEQMKKAASIAQATEFIDKLPEAYDYAISQGGTNVSGGQKQRLSIARALIKAPEIYIFDDSFSALDFKTDAALRKALATETKEATVLIVAQRISTVMHAQQIIVLDEGKIVGMGRHEELIKNCPVYREIALSQLSEKELSHEFHEPTARTAQADTKLA